MKNILSFRFAVIALLIVAFDVHAAHKPAANSSLDTLALICETDGLASPGTSSGALRSGVTRGPDIKVSEGYVIKVFYTKDDQGNVVGFLEKGPQLLETARVTKICLNQHIHPSKCNKDGEIEFLSHLGKPLNILFRLNKKKMDDGYLALTSWRSTAGDSLAVSDAVSGDQTPPKPDQGHYPKSKCLRPEMVKGGGENKDISFEFSQCLTASQDDINFAYNLFFDRHNTDGTTSHYSLDPQIINHGH